MVIRKALQQDLDGIEKIYNLIHTGEENGDYIIGWARGVYPTRKTAEDSLNRGDLFVLEEENEIMAAAIINQQQVDVYEKADWKYKDASAEDVMVLHTLVVSPESTRRGYGRAFVKFYENYAKEQGCPYLRMDTNEKNTVARKMYAKLGYDEVGIVPCVFNGIDGVQLVCLEKRI